MMNENEKKLFALLDRFCNPENAQLSTEELHQIIFLLGNEKEDECVARWMQQCWTENSDYSDKVNRKYIFERVRRQIEKIDGKRLSFMQFLYRIAAVLIIPLLGLCVYLFVQTVNLGEPVHTEIVEILVDSHDMPSRITLSDGSTVVLQGGSRLIKKNNFTGSTREIILEGEAFFDIAHNPNKPFIIHTGQIRTTILGTSLSARAIPGETSMTIVVTEGTVKIEDDRGLLTILEANQQFTYGFELDDFRQNFQQEAIEMDVIEMEISQPDFLIFRNMPFGDITRYLAVRHGINIVFQDENLSQQRIDALLDSRKPIDVLLRLLCAAQQATYTFEEGVFVISCLR